MAVAVEYVEIRLWCWDEDSFPPHVGVENIYIINTITNFKPYTGKYRKCVPYFLTATQTKMRINSNVTKGIRDFWSSSGMRSRSVDEKRTCC